MESREAWSALQSHLASARARLDAGDYSAALEAVNAALAIDPAFLAAHSLRQRIELDRATAAPPAAASRPQTGTAPAVVPPVIPTDEPDPAPTPRVPAGRRFGVLLADVYDRKRTDAAPLVESPGHRTALPPPAIPAPPVRDPLPTPAPRVEILSTVPPPPVLAAPVLVEATDPVEQPIENREAGDMLRQSPSIQDPDFFDLRLNADDDDLDGPDRELFRDDWSQTTSRGPKLVFIGAVVLAALIVGERPIHFVLPYFTSLIQLPNFMTAAVNPTSEPGSLSLLTARRLENPPVALTAGGRSMDTAALATRVPDDDVRASDAPTIRTVSVSNPAPASTVTRTPVVPVDEAPSVQPETAAVVPASVPPASVAAPTPRTADAEPASYTRPGGETAPAPPPVAPSSGVDEQSVKTALQRYRNAYEKLDAKSARTVWPSVNEAALARAFDSLESQTLTFTTCDVDFRGPAAVATCEGSTKYTPRYGSHEPREEPRVWTFTLKKLGAEWKIDSVKAGR